MQRPTPHLEKLTATLANEKLPASDKLRVNVAIDKYKKQNTMHRTRNLRCLSQPG